MKPSPQISIVLPVYNGARYLAEAIESCLSQTFIDFELIIVDDASTDESPQIIAHYCGQDERICSIRQETNQKLPAALNRGFLAARGDFLTWTSDDNRYCPEALEIMYAYLNDNPGTDIVYSDYSEIDSCDKIHRHVTAPDPVYIMRENVVGPSFLYRRRVYEVIGGYDPELFLVEDYDYWLRAAQRFPIVPLHRNLYFYRRHDASLTSLHHPQVVLNHEIALRKNLPYLQWLPVKAVVAGWTYIAILAFNRKAYCTCARALFHAAGKSPLQTLSLAIRILCEKPRLISRLCFPDSIEAMSQYARRQKK